MSLVEDENVKLEAQHHQFNNGAHHKHLLYDVECRREYDHYYAKSTYESWVTYDFKGESVELAGVGFGSAYNDWNRHPDSVRVLAYSSNQDADSEAFEIGSWSLNYNNKYMSTEKFALK
jgi:hypothetical protein